MSADSKSKADAIDSLVAITPRFSDGSYVCPVGNHGGHYEDLESYPTVEAYRAHLATHSAKALGYTADHVKEVVRRLGSRKDNLKDKRLWMQTRELLGRHVATLIDTQDGTELQVREVDDGKYLTNIYRSGRWIGSNETGVARNEKLDEKLHNWSHNGYKIIYRADG